MTNPEQKLLDTIAAEAEHAETARGAELLASPPDHNCSRTALSWDRKPTRRRSGGCARSCPNSDPPVDGPDTGSSEAKRRALATPHPGRSSGC